MVSFPADTCSAEVCPFMHLIAIVGGSRLAGIDGYGEAEFQIIVIN